MARALATQPRLLLLDEPSAGMNPHETLELDKLIIRLRDRGITIILVEHDMRLVRSEEHTSELQSHVNLVCRLLLERYVIHPDLHSFPTRRSSDLRWSWTSSSSGCATAASRSFWLSTTCGW